PLFTILEDLGYLPRVAFNLDKAFRKCCACGKQALTMCMGFGCNACGVTGARIIDSPRERLIAILTNNFVPCNGRFPTLISIISMFLVGGMVGGFSSVLGVLILTLVILLGIYMTFFVSKILSKTLLKGKPSSFILELPPYRKPQIGKVIVRSIFDRTLFVLGRAVISAVPAGIIIWTLANVNVSGMSLLSYATNFLNPFASLIGLDGVILMAFILGFPANEIVVPIILMAYLSTGKLIEISDLAELKMVLVDNGWTITTAICTMLFSLFHWPCATTMLTIKKETGSWKWTLLAFCIPTAIGMALCFLVAQISSLIVYI
ncbi:MAG: ferrous iron transporter B, partial [Clostridia bacterium]|nr:ferrous iron transporter B [Clostridia bacterium]